ncbi:tyrosine recombinase XerC [Lysobacter enzymogenes]|uniref:site-specific integrase n=1 Tax=Lysobacter enzymogenes TaxID=69 RepID=UPI00384CD53C
MARARKYDPTIPKHIDQNALPVGIYWNASGRGRWYIIDRGDPAAPPRKKTVAGPKALLSELHDIVERSNSRQGTVGWIMEQFRKSSKWEELSDLTHRDYRYVERVLKALPVKAGGHFSDLVAERLTRVAVQAVVERVAKEGTPTKANKIQRYLSRLFAWAENHVGLTHNPAFGVEKVRERKRQRLPADGPYNAILAYAMKRAAITANTKGSIAPYLPWFLELTYLCRLRGVETLTLTLQHKTKAGITTNRRKGSKDNTVKWTPRLRRAWNGAIAYREGVLARKARQGKVVPDSTALFLNRDGQPLDKDGLDTLWQRFIKEAIAEKVIPREERFSPHDLKRKGITDTPGTGAEKKDAAGLSEAMMKTYDKSVPTVKPSAK